MLKIEVIEIFLRIIPESILFLASSHILTKTKIDTKKMIWTTAVLAIAAYLFRLLPVEFGIHSILSLTFMVFLNIKVHKINAMKAIRAAILIFATMFVSEIINLLLLVYGLKVDMQLAFATPWAKIVYGLPSIVIFIIFIGLMYLLYFRKKDD